MIVSHEHAKSPKIRIKILTRFSERSYVVGHTWIDIIYEVGLCDDESVEDQRSIMSLDRTPPGVLQSGEQRILGVRYDVD